MKWEVVVVGGGPAGALAAAASAEARARTLILERAPTRIPCCAGLVSPATAQRLQIPSSLILREIRGVRVYSPTGKVAELRAEEPKGLVLDRLALNQWLLKKAQEKGAAFWPISAREFAEDFVLTEKGKVEFEVLVGADGAQSGVARAFGLPRPREMLVAVQADIRVELEDWVEIHLGIVPDFFAWAVPEKEGVAKVGLATCSGRAAFDRLRDFLGQRFPGAEVLRIQAGLIPIGPPTATVQRRVILVGNAAAQVKPLTGGGLAFISLCAPIAGKIVAMGPAAIPQYERTWREILERELAFQEGARKLFLSLEPKDLEETVKVLRHKKVAEILQKIEDIDRLAELPKKVLRSPDLWPILWPFFRLFSAHTRA
ncbi:geranylgeranyl reductase family protein [Candidatus Bipolaricaulota bacterium]|nr:geranylgeranyl reductase family protein [Candidatus Bipolaricaulota bacterium]